MYPPLDKWLSTFLQTVGYSLNILRFLGHDLVCFDKAFCFLVYLFTYILEVNRKDQFNSGLRCVTKLTMLNIGNNFNINEVSF